MLPLKLELYLASQLSLFKELQVGQVQSLSTMRGVSCAVNMSVRQVLKNGVHDDAMA